MVFLYEFKMNLLTDTIRILSTYEKKKTSKSPQFSLVGLNKRVANRYRMIFRMINRKGAPTIGKQSLVPRE